MKFTQTVQALPEPPPTQAPVHVHLHKPGSSHFSPWDDLEAIPQHTIMNITEKSQLGCKSQRNPGSFREEDTFNSTAEICPFINGSGLWSQASKQLHLDCVSFLQCPGSPSWCSRLTPCICPCFAIPAAQSLHGL